MELKDKRIIVSGCAKGMGEATLNSYVKAGAHVIGMDIDSELGQTVAENANKNDEGKSSFLSVDIGNPQSVSEAFAKASNLLGGLDVLAPLFRNTCLKFFV